MNDDRFKSILQDVCDELSKRIATHSAEHTRLMKLLAALQDVVEILDDDRASDRARNTPAMAVRPRARRERGGNAQLALELLDAADKPLTTRQIAEAILLQRGENWNDPDALRQIIPSIAVALRRHARKGRVDDGGAFPSQWRIVKRPPNPDRE